MRRYDEPIEVRRGLVAGQEAPEQFIWRGRLWVVRDVVSHWVETGAWWEQEGIAALLGVGAETMSTTPTTPTTTAVRLGADLLAESDVWRVEACRGQMGGRQRRWTPRGDGVARWTVRSGEAARTGSTSHPPNKPPESSDGADSDFDLGYGVFDLAFDWTSARWRLIGCVD